MTSLMREHGLDRSACRPWALGVGPNRFLTGFVHFGTYRGRIRGKIGDLLRKLSSERQNGAEDSCLRARCRCWRAAVVSVGSSGSWRRPMRPSLSHIAAVGPCEPLPQQPWRALRRSDGVWSLLLACASMLVSVASARDAIPRTVPPPSASRRAPHRSRPPPCSLPPLLLEAHSPHAARAPMCHRILLALRRQYEPLRAR
jgi:hypothetical protein